MPDGKVCPEQFRGWLLKWTNYIKGYQRRWFVLANGLLSYYRTQEEMAHTCRGTINLASAFIDTIDSTHFIITNGPSQVYHLRALNEVERQRWVTALELAKARAIKKLESDQSGSEDELDGMKGHDDHSNPLAALQSKLKEVTTAYDLVVKNNQQMTKLASELEAASSSKGSGKPVETVALMRLTCSAVVKAADDFVVQAQSTERRWSRALQHEHLLRLQLQENMVALAGQMQTLEEEASKSIQGKLPSRNNLFTMTPMPSETNSQGEKTTPTSEYSKASSVTGTSTSEETDSKGLDSAEEEETFFDAPDIFDKPTKSTHSGGTAPDGVAIGHRRSASGTSVNDGFPMQTSLGLELIKEGPLISSDLRMAVPVGPSPSFFQQLPPVRQWRTHIPPKPSHKLNLWSVMKNCIGRDLSKIPMPVNFNEPLSMLQRMSEDLVHSYLLDKAAQCSSTLEEAAYVAAYINSAYASTATRVGKPFNPLLYETFELDHRSDPERGYRLLAEQVSHHPPMFAMHVEHKEWSFRQEYTVASKFRGKYLVCYPLGCCHVVIYKSRSHYTWTKVTTTIHNIIVGKLWIDQSGDLKITNHTTGEACHVKYHAYSYFSRERQRKITGSVYDKSGAVRYVINGHWDGDFTWARVLSLQGKTPITEEPVALWTASPPEAGSEVMYGFSKFVCSLNEPEEGMAPTDSRHRPDVRTMEKQDFDSANTEKVKLEEKQRARRRKREAVAAQAVEAAEAGNTEEAERLKKESTISPVWFSKEYDQLTGSMMHVYKGGYWETKGKKEWDKLNLPDIF